MDTSKPIAPKGFSSQTLLLVLAVFAMLYGSSYQQFKHFNIDDPKGLDDAKSYVSMFEGNYNVPAVHRYRFIVPYLASLAGKGIEPFFQEKKEICKLSFYAVNSFVMTLAALLLFRVLRQFGFDWKLSLLGIAFFLNSRIIVYSVGCPLVDSAYYLAIVAVVYLTVTNNGVGLVCLNPLLLLSKETILPFLFLPFLNKKIGKTGLAVSLTASILINYGVRRYISGIVDSQQTGLKQESFSGVVMQCVENMGSNLAELSSLKGLHDLQHGFSFLLVFAVFGYFINQKNKKYEIPPYLLTIMPISLFFALLSSNAGRLFFSSFVVVLPYSLIFLEYFFSGRDGEGVH